MKIIEVFRKDWNKYLCFGDVSIKKLGLSKSTLDVFLNVGLPSDSHYFFSELHRHFDFSLIRNGVEKITTIDMPQIWKDNCSLLENYYIIGKFENGFKNDYLCIDIKTENIVSVNLVDNIEQAKLRTCIYFINTNIRLYIETLILFRNSLCAFDDLERV